MDLPPINDKRCDNKMCKYASMFNVLVLFLTLILITGFAQAEMRVIPLFVDFAHDDAYSKDVEVFNKGEHPIYVKVEVREVKNPGTEQEKRLPVQKLSDKALVAVPEKLTIPGNSKKNVRLTSLGTATSKDTVYRISYTPAYGQLKAKSTGIKILVAYEGLVVIRPPKPVAHIEAERKGDTIVFRNTGNTNAILERGSQCDPQNKAKCESLTTRRLYAGNVWEYKLPFSGPVTYEVNNGVRAETRVFGK